MILTKLNGLISATYTPLHPDGTINLDLVAPMVQHLIQNGINGFYVCGSTGEGMSMSTSERKQVAEAYINATENRVPVIVQVGHNSLEEAKSLATHAAESGADAISATCPSYFKVGHIDVLIDCMSNIALSAPDTPFYYYHIPALTDSTIDIVEFMKHGQKAIPTLAGLKYTDTKLFEFLRCQNIDSQLDVVFGCDEMLLGGLASGAKAAIGSTYNVLAPIYHQLISAFERGDMETARLEQLKSINFIQTLMQFPFHSAMKEVIGMLGIEMGPCRLPQRGLKQQESAKLRRDLELLGFFDWLAKPNTPQPSAPLEFS